MFCLEMIFGDEMSSGINMSSICPVIETQLCCWFLNFAHPLTFNYICANRTDKYLRERTDFNHFHSFRVDASVGHGSSLEFLKCLYFHEPPRNAGKRVSSPGTSQSVALALFKVGFGFFRLDENFRFICKNKYTILINWMMMNY